MDTGIEIKNTENQIIINQDFCNLRLIKRLWFKYGKGKGATGSEVCTEIPVQQAGGVLFNPAMVCRMELPDNVLMCAVKPKTSTAISYDIIKEKSGKTYIYIYSSYNEWSKGGAIDLDIYAFGLPKVNKVNETHKYGLQIFRDNGDIAFDALDTDYMKIAAYDVLKAKGAHLDMLNPEGGRDRRIYKKIKCDDKYAIVLVSPTFYTSSLNEAFITFAKKIGLRNVGDTINIETIDFQVMSHNRLETMTNENDEIHLPYLVVDVSKLTGGD